MIRRGVAFILTLVALLAPLTGQGLFAQQQNGGNVERVEQTPAPPAFDPQPTIASELARYEQQAREAAAEAFQERGDRQFRSVVNNEVATRIERVANSLSQRVESLRAAGTFERATVEAVSRQLVDERLAAFDGWLLAAIEDRPPPPEWADYADRPYDYAVDATEWILFRGNTLTNWILLLVGIAAGVFSGFLVSGLLKLVQKRLSRGGETIRGSLISAFASPANLALTTMGVELGVSALRLPDVLDIFAGRVLSVLYYIALFILLWRLVEVLAKLLGKAAARTNSNLDNQLIPLVRKTLRIFLIIIFTLFIAQNIFDLNIAGFLAGLGIAGLAVSLAAQDSLRNLFGSITIFADRPFKVGDAIKFAGHWGPVEDIGFRSVKMRTWEGHLITIPNSLIVNETVENVGARPYIRRWFTIGITYDTPPEKLQEAIDIIKSLLDGHEGFREEWPFRVVFEGFGDFSLNILVVYYYHPADYWMFMDFSSRLNRQIFERFGEAGIDFAFPSRTIYVAGDDKRRLTLKMLSADLRSNDAPHDA